MWVEVGRCEKVGGSGDARLSVCKQTVSRVFRSLNLTRSATPKECGGLKCYRSCRRPFSFKASCMLLVRLLGGS